MSALGVGASLAVFALAAYILGKTLSNLSYADLMERVRRDERHANSRGACALGSLLCLPHRL
ncbi:MAG: hypothetical protein U1E25_11380 [Methylocystis sp.]